MYKLQQSFQNHIFCKLGSHQRCYPFLALADEGLVLLLTWRPAGRLADFCMVLVLNNAAFLLVL